MIGVHDYRTITVLHRGEPVEIAYWLRDHTRDTIDWTFCYGGDRLPADPTPAEDAAIQCICERDFRERRAAFVEQLRSANQRRAAR